MQLFRSKGHSSRIPEIQSLDECGTLLNRELVIFFKHSPTCPVSWMAHREVEKFLLTQPDAPIFLVSVRQHRDVSQHLAQVTGVQHESPQVLVMRNGTVVGNASHDDITAEYLTQLSSETAPANYSRP